MDNALGAKISAARIPLKMSVSAAFNFWGLIALGIAAYSIYLSFTGSWWWFIPGFITAGAILKSNDSGNAKSVLHSAMADPAFYERVRRMNGWVYQIDEQDAARYRIG